MIRRLMVRRYWGRALAEGRLRTWAAEPTVRRCLNRRVTGSPDVWPLEWFAAEIAEGPFPRALSLGCGEGVLERDLMAKGLCGTVLGLDLSEQALALARQRAREAGHPGIAYERADLDRLRLEPGSYDAVFVHQALHHVRELEACLGQAAGALKAGGVLYADEYVGPSRHEWRRELLAAAEAVFRELPAAARSRRRWRPLGGSLPLPVDWRDPSEAVRSSEIVPLIETLFEVRERRDYGGNLLAVIYPHLRLDALEPAAREEVLGLLLAREDELLASGVASYYAVIVAGR
jgi:SAM-dependent methyltransferase